MTVRRNIAANYLGQAWVAVMSLAFVPWYIRYLGMEAYGLIGAFAVLQTWLSLLDFGLMRTLAREMAQPGKGAGDVRRLWDLLRSIELAMAAISIGIATLLWGSADWIATSWLQAQHLSKNSVAGACALMGVVAAFRFLENVYSGSLVGLQKQVSLNVATSVLATLRGIGAVAVLAWIQNDIEAFFVWQAAMSVLTTLVFAVITYRGMPPFDGRAAFSYSRLRSVGSFSASTFAISLLGFLISQTDKLLLSKMLDLAEFGRYALAATLAAYVRLLATSVYQAVFPKLVQLHALGRHGELALYYHRSTQLSVVLMGGLGVGLGIFGEYFLLAWTQDRELAAKVYPLLWLLLVGMVTNGVMNGPYYLQMAAGWTSMLLKTNVAMASVFVPLLFFMVTRFGALGAAATWAMVNLLYLGLVVTLMHRKILPSEQWRWYIVDLGQPLLGALAAGFAVRLAIPSIVDSGTAALWFATGCSATVVAAALAAPHVRGILAGGLSRILRHA